MNNSSKAGQGKKALRKYPETRVVFCGIVRDCAKNLGGNLKLVESLRDSFASLRIVLVENDSQDTTKQVLADLANRDPSAIVESKNFNTVTLPKKLESGVNPSFSRHRIEKLSVYRNRYLELIESEIGFDNLDYVVMLDWDVHSFSICGFFNSLDQHQAWDVATANGRWKIGLSKDVYYDVFAYAAIGMDGPCTEKSIFEGREALAGISNESELVEVQSGFSALAIYKSSVMHGLKYRAQENEDERVEVWCEHVTLHRDLAEKGGVRIVINQRMTVVYNTRIQAIIKAIREIFARRYRKLKYFLTRTR